jgi:hypothetical protein
MVMYFMVRRPLFNSTSYYTPYSIMLYWHLRRYCIYLYCWVVQITGTVHPHYYQLLWVYSDPHMIFCACSMQNGPHESKVGHTGFYVISKLFTQTFFDWPDIPTPYRQLKGRQGRRLRGGRSAVELAIPKNLCPPGMN